MKEKSLSCWEEFEEISTKVIAEVENRRKQANGYVSLPLFRGQSDAKWRLKSTLDRVKEGMRVSEYYEIISIIHDDIAINTGKRWISEAKVLNEIIRSDLLPYDIHGDDEYDTEKARFMVYLRHNGFPSPLLDWTRSPYIAAFFAFNDIWSEKNSQNTYLFSFIKNIRDTVKARLWATPIFIL